MSRAAMSRVIQALWVAAIVAALLAAGQSDYEDELREQERYCRNVSEGTWPDYRGDYAETCLVPD